MFTTQQGRTLFFIVIFSVSQHLTAETQNNLPESINPTITTDILTRQSHPYISQNDFLTFQEALSELYSL
jgi:hypothetical protein